MHSYAAHPGKRLEVGASAHGLVHRVGARLVAHPAAGGGTVSLYIEAEDLRGAAGWTHEAEE